MATSIGQYTPVFFPGETPSLTEKPGRPQSTGSQRVGHYRSDPALTDARCFACGRSAPVRVERESGASVWLAGTLAARSVQGHGLSPLLVGVMVSSESFSRASLASLSVALPLQALTGVPCLGFFSIWSVRHIEGPPGWGPTP